LTKKKTSSLRNDVYLSMKREIGKPPSSSKALPFKQKKKEEKKKEETEKEKKKEEAETEKEKEKEKEKVNSPEQLQSQILQSMKEQELAIMNKSEMKITTKKIMSLFNEWVSIAELHPWIKEANSMCLSTISNNGNNEMYPDSRMVLLKGHDKEKGIFTFFTNYESDKSKQLMNCRNCSLLFYWEPLRAAIRIQGTVEQANEQVSDQYWYSRPYQSQLSSAISDQSRIVENRSMLENKMQQLDQQYQKEQKVPRPKHWGGFHVKAFKIEFWNGGDFRFHRRILFSRLTTSSESDSWNAVCLQP